MGLYMYFHTTIVSAQCFCSMHQVVRMRHETEAQSQFSLRASVRNLNYKRVQNFLTSAQKNPNIF